MNKTKQQIAIAEACGWTEIINYGGNIIKGFPVGMPTHLIALNGQRVPDYLNDLNAMHEAENVLPDIDDDEGRDQLGYMEILADVVGARWTSNNQCDMWRLTHATAAQRAEAFLRTIGKWKEEA